LTGQPTNPADHAATAPLTLTLPTPLPTITAVHTTDQTTGTTTYQLTGPRLAGSITVSGERWPDGPVPVPERIRLELGTWTALGHLVDRPTVNGVRASGHIDVTPADIPQLAWQAVRAHLQRVRGGALPDRAGTYLGAAAHAVLTHWAARPDRDALMLASARHCAPRRLEHLTEYTIAPLRRKIADLTDELRVAEHIAAALRALTDPATSTPAGSISP